MKNLLILIILIFFFSCHAQKIQSSWVDNHIIVDGVIEDWKDIPRTFEKDLKMMLGIANNDDNLYIMYCFNDPNLARMIAMRGITIWFNDEGNKDKIFGISFKREFDRPSESLKKRSEDEFDQPPNFNRDMINDLNMSRFMIQIKDSLMDVPIENESGIEAGFEIFEGIYGFEFKVPLSKIKESQTILKIPDDKQLSIGIEIPEHGMFMAGSKRQNSDRPGGRIQGGRSGMGGERGGHSPDFDRMHMDMGAKEMRITVVLAKNST
jgi:hypothetical protein